MMVRVVMVYTGVEGLARLLVKLPLRWSWLWPWRWVVSAVMVVLS